jgi:GMP synthase-like glutamine amidotransferase
VRIQALQHVPFEGPGAIASWAKARGHELGVARLHDGEMPGSFEALVVMGGPLSVHDEQIHPWLAPEKLLIRRAIDEGKRVLGVCLGGQLVAEVLGGKVTRNPEREIGWFPVDAAESTPIARALPRRFEAFHWHGETFSLPPGAVRVASSAGCANQAFAWGERVLALQFHLETTREVAAALVENCRDELTPGRWVQSEKEIVGSAEQFEALNARMVALLDPWVAAD